MDIGYELDICYLHDNPDDCTQTCINLAEGDISDVEDIRCNCRECLEMDETE